MESGGGWLKSDASGDQDHNSNEILKRSDGVLGDRGVRPSVAARPSVAVKRSKLGVEASMAEAAAQRKAKAPEPKTPHSTRQSRHEEAENVYRRQVDLEIDASRHVVRKRVKNKT